MNTLDFKTIGSKIRERRTYCGYTQEYIAQRLDVNPSHICNIEGGRANPSLTSLINIANVLECSVDYFILQEYTYNISTDRTISLDDQIAEKIKYRDRLSKLRILKILDLI